MKILSLTLLIVLTGIFSSFDNKEPKHRFQKDGFCFIPGGTQIINGKTELLNSFYLFATEISNAEYRTFLSSLKVEGKTSEFKIANVDSAKWSNALSYNEPYVHYYFNFPAYKNYPVVNISRKGAELYCTWLAEKYKKEGLNVEVRLPMESEWIYAAKAGNADAAYADDKNVAVVSKVACFNFRTATGEHENADVTAPVYSYMKNKFGLYNMCGNVAEMVSDRIGTRGGSYNSDAGHVKIEGEDEYAGVDGGSPYIGFRPVMVVK